MSERLGFSGSVAERFLQTEITPLLALLGLGLFPEGHKRFVTRVASA